MDVKILMLVLASDTSLVYRQFQSIWRMYMRSHPNIDSYFYKADPNLESEYKLDGDTLWIRMEESIPTIYEKTLKAFEYFFKTTRKYDFVFRPNLSSFIILKKYVEYCQTFPKTNLAAAFVGGDGSDTFPSGSGFTLSSDVVLRLLQDHPKLYRGEDDLTIGKWLYEQGIPIQALPRCDFVDDSSIPYFREGNEDSTFHYRVKNTNRQLDFEIHMKLLKKFYQ